MNAITFKGHALSDIPDGVYDDMPEEIYHAIPRLSNSGVKNLLISPMTFYVRSWLNPSPKPKENDGLTLGKAYHARVLEGRDVFLERFYVDLDPADHPNALRTNDELKDWIRTYSTATGDKIGLGGAKDDLIARILAVDPGAPIWSAMHAAHAEKHPGKTPISPEWWQIIERDAAYIERHATIGAAFRGGKPEVTILWTHRFEDRLGSGQYFDVRMKTRIDRLKTEAIVDLKTYANPLDKPLMRAITSEIATRRYHLQAATYYRAVDYAVEKGWLPRCTVEGQQEPHAGADGRAFVFVFQSTGDDPTPSAWIMSRHMQWVDLAFRELDNACATYVKFMASHGAEPWLTAEPLKYLQDEDFPAWMGG